jgi:hypothetical protein
MPKSSFDNAIRTTESWAEVRAHGRVIRYRRSGLGPTLLLLDPPDQSELLWPELLEALDTGFRLIVPEPPPTEADVACWLATFLEGLGVPEVSVLAGGCFCIPALELALSPGDQVARLVLVPAGSGAGEARGGTLDTVNRQVAVPLLVVRRDQPADGIVPLVTRFLRGNGSEVPA